MDNNSFRTVLVVVTGITICVCSVAYHIYKYNIESIEHLTKNGYVLRTLQGASGTFWTKPEDK